jgi:hypothetical protein
MKIINPKSDNLPRFIFKLSRYINLREGINVLISVALLRKLLITVNVVCCELGTGVQLDQGMGFPLTKGPSGAISL